MKTKTHKTSRSTIVQKIIALFILIAFATLPLFLSSYYVNMFYMIGVFLVISMGLNILIGYSGIVSIGHAGLMATGAYAAAYFNTNHGFPFWINIIIGMLITLVLGSLLAIPTIRAGGIYLAMITIAFGVIVDEVLIRWDSVTGGPLGLSGIDKPSIGSFDFKLEHLYYLVLIISVLTIWITSNLRDSKWGRDMLAVKENQIAAESLGVKTFNIQYVGFALSSVLAGLGGTLYAHTNSYISPDIFGFMTSIQLVLIVILGGAGTIWGPVIGAIIILSLPEFLNSFDKLRLAIYGLVMLIVLYVLPKGIIGTLNSWIMKRRNHNHVVSSIVNENINANDVLSINKSESSKGPILSIRNLNKSFGGLKVIQGLSFDIQPSTVHALIGPNGAGKSTVINMISGFYQPTSGEIELNSENVTGNNANYMAGKGIARTFQHTRLFSDLTVLENIMVGVSRSHKQGIISSLLKTPNIRRRERFLEEKSHQYLDLVGYRGPRDIKAEHLPYGHQRIVEIARALSLNPKLLLLDEPAAGLTTSEIEELEHVMSKLKKAGLTMILIEHHMDFVTRISDKITVIDYGKKIAEGSPEEVVSNPDVIKAYLGEEDIGYA